MRAGDFPRRVCTDVPCTMYRMHQKKKAFFEILKACPPKKFCTKLEQLFSEINVLKILIVVWLPPLKPHICEFFESNTLLLLKKCCF